MSSPQPSTGRRRAQLASLAALLLSALHFATYDVLRQPLVTDVRYYVYLAWQTTEGVAPHLSTFDPKTQFATFAGALFLSLGELVGADPLVAMRVGFLGIATLGGWLVFLLFRRLGRGSELAGFLGLLAYCSYGLIGALPAIGPIPKLGMAVCTTGTALLVHDRRWLLAGAVATLGFLDWQIGAFTCVAALGCALWFGEPRRAAAVRVLAGGALAALPYALYFASKGALGVAFEQTVVSAFFRGSAAMKRRSFGEHLEWMLEKTRADLPEQFYLVPLGLVGVLFAIGLALRLRHDPRLRLLVPLVLVHLGVLGFGLIDFQGHGDLNVLLHGQAFFQGCVWVALLFLLRQRLPAGVPRKVGGAVLLVVAVALTRPGPLRPEFHVSNPFIGPDGTLADQEQVATLVEALTRDRRFGVFENSEYLWFLRHTNPLPTIYWNPGTLSYVRLSADEREPQALARLVQEARLDALIRYPAHRQRALGPPWKAYALASDNGEVQVLLELLERD